MVILKLHHLRPAVGAHPSKTRVGRGDGSKGKTAGRGTKGTKARNTVRRGFEGGALPFHMKVPKLRGFKNPFRIEYQVVNLDDLSRLFPSGGKIEISDLVEKGLVRANQPVKLLGEGDISSAYEINVHKSSKTATAKIEENKGKVSLIV